ncbi:Glutamate receptor ionotropic like protein [Argiope bruennichi]|uniref:Glutamate receptor ionotropic like protein n=1 Tax=Argiope bruennichi TaxID=94029 RepID=A0A8T0E8C0_ARGBR|nr:Glutamate receptor ionotropic like protein [Argiope bruennichi]
MYGGHTGEVKLGGVDGRLLSVLSQVLQFQYELVSPADRMWGNRLKNGNWTGLIGMVSRGEADLAIGFLSPTEDRLTAVDFTEPYSVNEICFATHQPRIIPQPHSFLYSFKWDMWLSIAAVWIILPFIFYVKSRKKSSYLEMLFQLFRSILRQNMINIVTANRFLLAIWLYFALVISSSYTAGLATLHTMDYIESPVRNFEELSLAVTKGKYRAFATQSIVDYLLQSDKYNIVQLGHSIVENNWFPPLSNSLDEMYFDGRTAIIDVKLVFGLQFGLPPWSTKYISEDVLDSVSVGIAIRKDFCCKAALDALIVRINRGGFYKKYLSEEMYKTWLKKYTMKSKTRKQITLNNIFPALTILVCGYALSICMLILEIFHMIYERNINYN